MARAKVRRSKRQQRAFIREQRKLKRKKLPPSRRLSKPLRDAKGRFRRGTGTPLPSSVAPFQQRIDRLEQERREAREEQGRFGGQDYERLRTWLDGFSTAEEAIENFDAYDPSPKLVTFIYDYLPADEEMSAKRRRLTA